MTVAWTFSTLDASETYSFHMNPNASDTQMGPRRADLGYSRSFHSQTGYFVAVAPKRVPTRWTFSGVCRKQEHYDAMVYWAKKQERIIITDHLNRSVTGRIVGFKGSQRAPMRPNVPYRHTYTVTVLVTGLA